MMVELFVTTTNVPLLPVLKARLVIGLELINALPLPAQIAPSPELKTSEFGPPATNTPFPEVAAFKLNPPVGTLPVFQLAPPLPRTELTTVELLPTATKREPSVVTVFKFVVMLVVTG